MERLRLSERIELEIGRPTLSHGDDSKMEVVKAFNNEVRLTEEDIVNLRSTNSKLCRIAYLSNSTNIIVRALILNVRKI